MNLPNDKTLMTLAAEAREKAYAPYSRFRVGAALLAASGQVYTGCNIENAAYTPTNCAERTAFFTAVSRGEREFTAIAIVGGPEGDMAPFCAPCGVCRQVIAEFCDKNFRILLGQPDCFKAYTFEEIIPFAFTPADLGK